jgi:hypothetical protein
MNYTSRPTAELFLPNGTYGIRDPVPIRCTNLGLAIQINWIGFSSPYEFRPDARRTRRLVSSTLSQANNSAPTLARNERITELACP